MSRRHADLAAAVACALVLTIVILALPAVVPLRLLLGLPFVLFLPGYTLLAALYPGKRDLEPVERVAFSLGLSLATVPLLGLALNYLPWGIRLAPIVATLDIYVTALAAVAVYRRERLPDAATFTIPLGRPLASWRTSTLLDRLLACALALAVVGLLAAIVVAATRPSGEHFTEFYLLGPGGKAADYPRQVAVGQPLSLIVGVTNHEGAAADYHVAVQRPGEPPMDLAPLTLADGKTWQQAVNVAAGTTPGSETVAFLLYKGTAPDPYRQLHLTLTIGLTPTPGAAAPSGDVRAGAALRETSYPGLR